MRVPARRILLTSTWALGSMAVVILLAVAVPYVFGARAYTVQTASMSPALAVGDIEITSPISPLSAQPGQIVLFKDPSDGARLVSHRVQIRWRSGNSVDFITKGDRNNTVERWSVPVNGQIGQVLYKIPKLGYAIAWLSDPLARALMIGVPAVLLCALALWDLWRPEKDVDAA
ncbi:MAG TPA: signal peptidase I [Solirubrobacterales bacterium]|nr:signal peptidase I [Solirubrobacterales bacterium]